MLNRRTFIATSAAAAAVAATPVGAMAAAPELAVAADAFARFEMRSGYAPDFQPRMIKALGIEKRSLQHGTIRRMQQDRFPEFNTIYSVFLNSADDRGGVAVRFRRSRVGHASIYVYFHLDRESPVYDDGHLTKNELRRVRLYEVHNYMFQAEAGGVPERFETDFDCAWKQYFPDVEQRGEMVRIGESVIGPEEFSKSMVEMVPLLDMDNFFPNRLRHDVLLHKMLQHTRVELRDGLHTVTSTLSDRPFWTAAVRGMVICNALWLRDNPNEAANAQP